jgi:hypothetical protein
MAKLNFLLKNIDKLLAGLSTIIHNLRFVKRYHIVSNRIKADVPIGFCFVIQ